MYPLNKSQANHYFTISVVLSKGHHHFGYAKLEFLNRKKLLRFFAYLL
ncbi:hypothetical protein TK11N_24980 [Tetragenococcus koreensis]|uniref:Uncharacterized protein n=1 Tax=Tetragenococcus koreensis TaxID=290335 RepID=A0AAN4UDW3_9ENTE|nr:hypothetical protein TK11N_24980 [Tetragenococcus koreensis]GEQ53150.1 hypothetical protein TK12N_24940 [Tetragenococcus koreensis]GEQ55652.1 hypothetical protein TK2N_24960 [Tetragenococcus koreensis]GEQ58153.1 hypothetical protein TK4N_24960 [Tetragenococcus koreensis]GEQ60655.1 hypothetical protein TK6N_24940 [Tetragenococcus koreensis]